MLNQPSGLTRADLEKFALFSEANLDALEPMLIGCPVRDLAAGEILIKVGTENRHLYLVISGELGVHLQSLTSPVLTKIGPTETVGELSMIDRQPASAFVIAYVPTRVLVLDEDLLWLLTESSHAVSSNLLRTLATRLRSGNRMIQRDRELLEQYKFQASVDALTGLFNRYWMDKMLTRQMDRSRNGQQALSLLLIDVDRFKQFNDSHGHVGGDCALRCVATAMRGAVRPTDLVARYGGEEFAVLLPGAGVQNAGYVAERLRFAVSQQRIENMEGRELPPVTVSVGVAQMKDDATLEGFVSQADGALYKAKDKGRNRVELSA